MIAKPQRLAMYEAKEPERIILPDRDGHAALRFPSLRLTRATRKMRREDVYCRRPPPVAPSEFEEATV